MQKLVDRYTRRSSYNSRSRASRSWTLRLRYIVTRLIILISSLYRNTRAALQLMNCCCYESANDRRRREQLTRPRDIIPLDSSTAALYPDNTVINSRYTVFNFIFKNLYEQFRRPLNFYFLLVALLQFISIIAPVNPLSTLLPLMFAFSLTAIKEGYDDVKRHRQDLIYNKTKRTVVDRTTGQWREVDNSAIQVGDVILLRQNEEIPCDCVVLAAPSSSVFIRTDNLDGEIDLKPRDVIAPRAEMLNGAPNPPNAASVDKDDQSEDDGVPTSSTLRRRPETVNFFSLDDEPATLLEKLSCVVLHCPPPSPIVELFDGVAEFTRRELSSSPVRIAGADVFPTGTAAAAHSSHSRDIELGDRRPHEGNSTVRISLSHRHLLPQSCLLKNTERAICVAVYTGNDTKCGMNKRPAPVKWAQIDKDVSKYSIFIFACQITIAVVYGVIGFIVNRNVEERFWYLPPPKVETAAAVVIYPLRFFLLTTVMIPVSFKFAVDMSKYYMSMCVEWDRTMVHSDRTCCKVRNSSILEDLGQIDYVLSDKTGTMTQNVMELQYVSVVPDFQLDLGALDTPPSVFASPTVNMSLHGDNEGPTTNGVGKGSAGRFPHTRAATMQAAEVQHFARMLALCNTVEVTKVQEGYCNGEEADPNVSATSLPASDMVGYQAASPDEVALCCGAAKLNVILQERGLRDAVLRIGPASAGQAETEEWQVHHVFLFSSERKAMGIIVEHVAQKRILVVVKGADDSVAKMLKTHPGGKASKKATSNGAAPQSWQEAYPSMAAHLRSYAQRGLRTLLVAQREITRQELHQFLRDTHEAELAMRQRQEKIDAVRTAMEANLDLIGITAIEDKLQEHVKETIGDVLQAGVKMWMLTGDKVETAEQIGLSCGLYDLNDRVIRIVEGDTEETKGDWERVLMETDLPPPPPGCAENGERNVSWGKLSRDERHGFLKMGRQLIRKVRHFGVLNQQGTAADIQETNGTGGVDDARTVTPPTVISPGSKPLAPPTPTPPYSGSNTGGAAGAMESRTVLIVQGGHVLERILSSPPLTQRLAELSHRCVSVICARTTPSQKAGITYFVRRKGFMTLAIGDGGNDVAMIQEAHVGVGIVGKEGQQAARAADFAIRQFSDLRQLLFVHGQQAYVRTAYVIKYSFYKSMIIAFAQLAYNMCGTYFSGGTYWNSYALTMWNGVYTLPQTLFYCLDRFAPRVVLERCPYLYKLTRQSVDMDVKEFFGWYVFRGVAQSFAMFMIVSAVLGNSFAFAGTGQTSTNDINFTVAYSALILSQMITVFLESHSITWVNLLALIGMPIFYILSTLAFSDIPRLPYFGAFRKTLHLELVLAALGIALAMTLPVTVLLAAREIRRPNPRDVLRKAEVGRQGELLRRKSYREGQSWMVRWLRCTPEAPSPSLPKCQIMKGRRSRRAADVVVSSSGDSGGVV